MCYYVVKLVGCVCWVGWWLFVGLCLVVLLVAFGFGLSGWVGFSCGLLVLLVGV